MSVETAGGPKLTDFHPTAADFRTEIVAGLQDRPRHLPCKFLYDERGSALFSEICTLPEYYPTRTEMSILRRDVGPIVEFCGAHCLLVELGSGNSSKTRLLLENLDHPAAYVPIDISRTQLQLAATALAQEHPTLEILPICADYAQRIQLPRPEAQPQRNVIFFPGSTIGNFEPSAAIDFLRHITAWCRRSDRLVIGVDLAKPRKHVEPAYNDSRGITAAFNLNLLVRANEELGANFRIDRFSHCAVYREAGQRIEMFLISKCDQTVQIGNDRFCFTKGERILTEYSYKYAPEAFERLAATAHWKVIHRWSDPRGWFGVFGLEYDHAHR